MGTVSGGGISANEYSRFWQVGEAEHIARIKCQKDYVFVLCLGGHYFALVAQKRFGVMLYSSRGWFLPLMNIGQALAMNFILLERAYSSKSSFRQTSVLPRACSFFGNPGKPWIETLNLLWCKIWNEKGSMCDGVNHAI